MLDEKISAVKASITELKQNPNLQMVHQTQQLEQDLAQLQRESAHENALQLSKVLFKLLGLIYHLKIKFDVPSEDLGSA